MGLDTRSGTEVAQKRHTECLAQYWALSSRSAAQQALGSIMTLSRREGGLYGVLWRTQQALGSIGTLSSGAEARALPSGCVEAEARALPSGRVRQVLTRAICRIYATPSGRLYTQCAVYTPRRVGGYIRNVPYIRDRKSVV